MKRALDLVQLIAPFFILGYSIYGLVFRRRFTLWGLPSSWWFVVGMITALMVMVVTYLERKNR